MIHRLQYIFKEEYFNLSENIRSANITNSKWHLQVAQVSFSMMCYCQLFHHIVGSDEIKDQMDTECYTDTENHKSQWAEVRDETYEEFVFKSISKAKVNCEARKKKFRRQDISVRNIMNWALLQHQSSRLWKIFLSGLLIYLWLFYNICDHSMLSSNTL